MLLLQSTVMGYLDKSGKRKQKGPHNRNTSVKQYPTWSGGQSCGAWGMLRSARRLRKTKSTPQLQPTANPPARLGLNLELQGREHYFWLQSAATTSAVSPVRGV